LAYPLFLPEELQEKFNGPFRFVGLYVAVTQSTGSLFYWINPSNCPQIKPILLALHDCIGSNLPLALVLYLMGSSRRTQANTKGFEQNKVDSKKKTAKNLSHR
jgi:hypothetical protein